MGEMADFALDQTIEEEMYRADAYHAPIGSELWVEFQEAYGCDPQQPIPELDYNCFTIDDLERCIARDLLILERSIHRSNGTALEINSQHNGALITLRSKCKKYAVAWSMRAGMVRTFRETGTLSIKQRNWMQTNYRGGTDKFIEDMSNPKIRDQLAFHVFRFNNWVQAVATGINPMHAWEPANKKAKDML